MNAQPIYLIKPDYREYEPRGEYESRILELEVYELHGNSPRWHWTSHTGISIKYHRNARDEEEASIHLEFRGSYDVNHEDDAERFNDIMRILNKVQRGLNRRKNRSPEDVENMLAKMGMPHMVHDRRTGQYTPLEELAPASWAVYTEAKSGTHDHIYTEPVLAESEEDARRQILAQYTELIEEWQGYAEYLGSWLTAGRPITADVDKEPPAEEERQTIAQLYERMMRPATEPEEAEEPAEEEKEDAETLDEFIEDVLAEV